MAESEEIGQEYPPDTWRIIDGEITRTTTYSTSSYTTTLCWCQGCEEPWMMYDDGSGTHGDCLGPSVPLGSLLPMQSGRREMVEDFDQSGDEERMGMWSAQPNDLIGGYIVTTYPHPLSEHDFRPEGDCSKRGYVIADCMSLVDAETIANLLNRSRFSGLDGPVTQDIEWLVEDNNRMRAQVQFLVDWMEDSGLLADGGFTFPDGEFVPSYLTRKTRDKSGN